MSYREVYDRWLADPEGWWLDAARAPLPAEAPASGLTVILRRS